MNSLNYLIYIYICIYFWTNEFSRLMHIYIYIYIRYISNSLTDEFPESISLFVNLFKILNFYLELIGRGTRGSRAEKPRNSEISRVFFIVNNLFIFFLWRLFLEGGDFRSILYFSKCFFKQIIIKIEAIIFNDGNNEIKSPLKCPVEGSFQS